MIVYDLRLDGVVHSDVTPPFVQSGLAPGQTVEAEVRARDTESGEEGEWSAITTAETPLPDTVVSGVSTIPAVSASGGVATVMPVVEVSGASSIPSPKAFGAVRQADPASSVSGIATIPAVSASGAAQAEVGDLIDSRVSGVSAIPAPAAYGSVTSVSGQTAHPNRINMQLQKADVVLIVERPHAVQIH